MNEKAIMVFIRNVYTLRGFLEGLCLQNGLSDSTKAQLMSMLEKTDFDTDDIFKDN